MIIASKTALIILITFLTFIEAIALYKIECVLSRRKQRYAYLEPKYLSTADIYSFLLSATNYCLPKKSISYPR
jgi:hypothetical protein